MSTNPISYIKLLLEDLKKETDQYVSYHVNDYDQISQTVNTLCDKPESLNHTVYSHMADIMNPRIFHLRKLNIEKLSNNYDENTLIAKLKSLGIYRADKNHVNEPQAEEDIEVHEMKDKNLNTIACENSITNLTNIEFAATASHMVLPDKDLDKSSVQYENPYQMQENICDKNSEVYQFRRVFQALLDVQNYTWDKEHYDPPSEKSSDVQQCSVTHINQKCILCKGKEANCQKHSSARSLVPENNQSNLKLFILDKSTSSYKLGEDSSFKIHHSFLEDEIVDYSNREQKHDKHEGFFKLPSMKIPGPETFVQVQVTHIISPTLFYGLFIYNNFVQLGPFEDFITFVSYLNDSKTVNAYKSLTRTPVVGELVIAPLAEDDYSFYRAKILQLKDHGLVQVFYIDSGNSAEILVTDLREFPAELSNIPAQAVTFSVFNKTSNNNLENWNSDLVVLEKINSVLLYSVLNCKVLGNQGEVLQVVAFLDGVDITCYFENTTTIKK